MTANVVVSTLPAAVQGWFLTDGVHFTSWGPVGSCMVTRTCCAVTVESFLRFTA